MELIATSRIPKAQARVNASKPYTAKLIEVIENVGAPAPGPSIAYSSSARSRRSGVIVTSDRGLAGSYASNIIRLAEQRIIELDREGKDVALSRSGRRRRPTSVIGGIASRRLYRRSPTPRDTVMPGPWPARC